MVLLLTLCPALTCAVNGLLLQAIDGLAGLIPEAGGPIALALTAPLSTVMNEVTVKLSDGSMTAMGDLFKKTVRGLVRNWVDSMATVAGNAIEAAKQKAEAAVVEVEAAALGLLPIDELLASVGTADDSLKRVLGIITPFLELIKPVFAWVFKLALPGLSGSLAQCATNTKLTLSIFEAGLCPGSDSQHAQITSPSQAAEQRQHAQAYLREHLLAARGTSTVARRDILQRAENATALGQVCLYMRSTRHSMPPPPSHTFLHS